MGREKGTLAMQVAGLLCCLPTPGTRQDFAIGAISHSARESCAHCHLLACSGL